MAYQIKYKTVGSKKYAKYKPSIQKPGKRFWILLTATVLLLVALAGEPIKRFLLPGDPEITEKALSNMVEDLRAGEPIKDAITAFCQDILRNAQVE